MIQFFVTKIGINIMASKRSGIIFIGIGIVVTMIGINIMEAKVTLSSDSAL